MSAHARTYAICFAAAAGLHAGLLYVWGAAFQTRPEYALAAGTSLEVTLVEAAGEPAAEIPPIPEPEPLPPPPAPVPEPLPEPPPPEPLPSEPAMVEPPRQQKPASTPRPLRSFAPAAPAKANAPPTRLPGGTAGGTGPAGARTLAKPSYLSNPPPVYPLASKQAHEQGVVMLTVSITEQGRVAAVRLRRSSGSPRLDEAARKAVERWRFSPGRVGGIAVRSEVEVPVRFQLR
ncbi:MAG: energy transducer TonB [Verrucomicrobiota bacterium]|nr:energy transducer TonB [Verrucomicrobiota bacterium]